MKISIRIRRLPAPDLAPLFATSFLIHLILLAVMTFLPSFLPAGTSRPTVYTVDLVDLPALNEPAAGGGAPAEPPIENPPAEEPPPPKPAEPEPAPPKKKPPPSKPPTPQPDPAPDTPPAAPDPAVETAPPAAAPTAPAAEPHQPPAPGSDRSGTAGGGTGRSGGAAVAPGFDDESFRYAYYANRMVNILRSHWNKPIRPPGATGTLRAVVFFVIGRDGSILRPELEESSGYSALDLSALRAVQEARRLPPLPLQYDRNSLGVHFFFELKPEETTGPFGASP